MLSRKYWLEKNKGSIWWRYRIQPFCQFFRLVVEFRTAHLLHKSTTLSSTCFKASISMPSKQNLSRCIILGKLDVDEKNRKREMNIMYHWSLDWTLAKIVSWSFLCHFEREPQFWGGSVITWNRLEPKTKTTIAKSRLSKSIIHSGSKLLESQILKYSMNLLSSTRVPGYLKCKLNHWKINT